MRVIKNPSDVNVDTAFDGKPVSVSSKKSLKLEGPKADKIADYLLETFGFLQDRTNDYLPQANNEKTEVKKGKGVRSNGRK